MLGSIGRDSGPGVGAFGFNSRADRIADRIQDLVRKDGLFGQNRSENMQEVREIFASLSPAEAQAVFKELSPMDIRGLVNDINKGGSFGRSGLSLDDKRDLFADLASKLDGKQLAEFASALESKSDQALFGNAVARYASNADKVEFVREQADDVVPGGFLGARSDRVDPDAVGVARVLDSLADSPRHYHAAMRALTPTQFAAVQRAG